MNKSIVEKLKEANKLDGLYLLADLIEREKDRPDLRPGLIIMQSVLARILLRTAEPDIPIERIMYIKSGENDPLLKYSLLKLSGIEKKDSNGFNLFTLLLLRNAIHEINPSNPADRYWEKSYSYLVQTAKDFPTEARNALDFLKKEIEDFWRIVNERKQIKEEYRKKYDKAIRQGKTPPKRPLFYPLRGEKFLLRDIFGLAIMLNYILYKKIDVDRIPDDLRKRVIDLLCICKAPEELISQI